MNTHEGYNKKTLANTNVLLTGGGDKSLSDFLSSIQYVSASHKILIKTAAANASWTDLVTLITTDENVKQTPKTDNVNRPLMMINGGTSAGEQTSTSMFSTGIYANASTKMITASGFIKNGFDDTSVLLAGGGAKAVNDFSLTGHNHDGRYYRQESHNSPWTDKKIPTDLNDGHHIIHISGVEYSSILSGHDYNGSYWLLYFHPTSGYTEDIKYRATNCSTWKTILDSNNSSVSLSGSTLTVKINGNSQSLTNTWRGITDTYNPTTASSDISLSLTGAKSMYSALLNGNANTLNSQDADYYRTCGMRNLIVYGVYNASIAGFRWTPGIRLTSGSLNRIGFSNNSGNYSISPYNSEGPYGYYSIAFWYKVESYSSGSTINVNINDCSCGNFNISGNKSWTFWTGSCEERTDGNRYGFVDFEGSWNAIITISDIVVVRGTNLSLTWFPAPEDLVNTYQNLTIAGIKTFSSTISGTISNANYADDSDKLDGQHGSYYATAASLDNYVTLNTVQTITGAKTFNSTKWCLKGQEYDNIINKGDYILLWKADDSARLPNSGSGSSITNSISFNWYNDEWRIGQVRNGSSDTKAFAIALMNSDDSHALDRFRIESGGEAYVSGNKVLHTGNASVSGQTITINGTSTTWLNTKYYLTLNGTNKGHTSGTNLGSFYAPTSAGTSGQYLKSNGSGAPTWATFDFASSGHSHTLKIETTSDNSSIDLAASTKYKLTAGGSTYVFKTPAAGSASGDYLPLAGGTMTGTIIMPANDSKGIEPATNNYGYVGSSSKKFYKMYATTFHGALSGNATTATTATKAKYLTNYTDAYTDPGLGAYSLSYYSTATDTSSASTNGIANPTGGDWYYHLLMIHQDSSGYFCDVAWRLDDHTDPSMYFRIRKTSSYTGWVKVLTSENYTDYISSSSGGTSVYQYHNQSMSSNTNYRILTSTRTSNGTLENVYSKSACYMNDNGVYFTSDKKMKKDIRIFSLETNIMDCYNPVRRFSWKSNDMPSIGFISQEVEEWCPEAVGISDDGLKTVNYDVALSALCGAMFNRIKELEQTVKELQYQININKR